MSTGRERRRSNVDGSACYTAFDSPVGTLYVALDGRMVAGLSFSSKGDDDFCEELLARTGKSFSRSDALARPVVKELREYFNGKRSAFSFRPDISGFTTFQQKVLRATAQIPFGQTRTYGWLAERADSPRASRAAGQVMARNPIPIIIPCHRVIDSSGGLCGFGGRLQALDLKKKLLAIEGVTI